MMRARRLVRTEAGWLSDRRGGETTWPRENGQTIIYDYEDSVKKDVRKDEESGGGNLAKEITGRG